MQEREKKAYLILRRMNSCSLSWASYCSSASEFRLNGESAVRWFSEFFIIFLGFQRKEEADNNALRALMRGNVEKRAGN